MRAGIALGLVLLVAACGAAGTTSRASTGAAAPGRVAIPRFTHVLVVVFENRSVIDVSGSPDAPTFRALGRRYATLGSYSAVAHPSLPNYLALVSGSTQGITSDCTDCVVDGRSLADTLGAAHRSWKAYAEGLPYAGFTGASSDGYAKRHVPFLYFRSVLRSPVRRRLVVPYSQLQRDLARRRLPDFALVVPDLCHDMHDCPVATGDAWLRDNVVPLLRSPALRGGVVFVVFDESSDSSDDGGGGQVLALALGPTVRRGSVFSEPTTHYGLLRTIEQAWGLPLLGQSATATPITGIWR